ncbi:helix-turn-helix domain-containing protein [Nonomuraea sp. NPDC049480]|uniref:helix-turn-helix domain-containing protein n=1 Tax=Nonomuraea sp. NPDC049480 TaxID=3364353 RepID=UPI0037BBE008
MDGKAAVLTAAGVFNQRAGAVVDPLFSSSAFFDPRDLVQVKYEMVRRVLVDRVPVTVAAAAFGFSRASFYTAAAALDAAGPAGLVPGKPGPKGPRKLTEPVMDRVEQWRAADPSLKGRALAKLIEAEFGFPVHPRSVERALTRRREPRDPEAATGR